MCANAHGSLGDHPCKHTQTPFCHRTAASRTRNDAPALTRPQAPRSSRHPRANTSIDIPWPVGTGAPDWSVGVTVIACTAVCSVVHA